MMDNKLIVKAAAQDENLGEYEVTMLGMLIWGMEVSQSESLAYCSNHNYC